jgi:hypothetical protein
LAIEEAKHEAKRDVSFYCDLCYPGWRAVNTLQIVSTSVNTDGGVSVSLPGLYSIMNRIVFTPHFAKREAFPLVFRKLTSSVCRGLEHIG